MAYNELDACVTVTSADLIEIDDSKFQFIPLPLIGEEIDDDELQTLICTNKLC